MSRFGLLFCFPSTVDSSVALLRRFARQRRQDRLLRDPQEAGARCSCMISIALDYAITRTIIMIPVHMQNSSSELLYHCCISWRVI